MEQHVHAVRELFGMMFTRVAAAATALAVCFGLARLRRKIAIELGQRRQRIFTRELLARSLHSKSERVIVSLTTLPDRIVNIRATLECLLAQTHPPDEIVLFVPEFSARQQRGYAIPSFLHELPRIRVVRVEQDWGPATKFIPVVQMELAARRPDTPIVVVDDDRIYPLETIESYLHWSAQLPDAALCFRGARMPRNLNWRDSRMKHGNRVRSPWRVDVITGCGSYMIKPRFFDQSLWDYSDAPGAAFYMDDIWISGRLDERGVEKYVVPSSRRLLSVKAQRRTMSLHDVPGGRQPNNNEVVAYFRHSWKVLAD